MLRLKTAAVILFVLTELPSAEVPGGLSYSGETKCDSATATLIQNSRPSG